MLTKTYSRDVWTCSQCGRVGWAKHVCGKGYSGESGDVIALRFNVLRMRARGWQIGSDGTAKGTDLCPTHAKAKMVKPC
jgi:hypothetical protein